MDEQSSPPAAARATAAALVGLSLGAGAAIRAWLATKASVFPYDAYYYLGTARDLGEHLSYSFRGQPHVRFPPGYPVLVAPGAALGLPAENVGIAVAIIAWAAVGCLAFLIGRRAAGVWCGTVACILVSLHPVSFMWGFWPMSEPVFTAACYLSVLAAAAAAEERRPSRLAWAGAFAGYAAVTRFEAIGIVPVLVIATWWVARDERATAASDINGSVDDGGSGDEAGAGRAEGGSPSPLGLRGLLPVPSRNLAKWALASAGLFAAPLVAWFVWTKLNPGQQLTYGPELSRTLDMSAGALAQRAKFFFWSGERWRIFVAGAYAGLALALWRKQRAVLLAGTWALAMLIGHLFWYFVSERFLLASIPGLAVAAAYGGVTGVQEVRRWLEKRPALIRAAPVVAAAALMAMMSFSGINKGVALAKWHIRDLNLLWGGTALVDAARQEAREGGGVATDRGAVMAFYAEKDDVVYLGEVAFDREELTATYPKTRVQQLREKGVKRVVIVLFEHDLGKSLRYHHLEGTPLRVIEIKTSAGPYEGRAEPDFNEVVILAVPEDDRIAPVRSEDGDTDGTGSAGGLPVAEAQRSQVPAPP